jgi:transposase, putative, N-terminal domain
MITVQCLLEFQSKQDRETTLDLMRRFSSAMRYAYQRLLEGKKRKNLKKDLPKVFNINTRYSDDAMLLAQSTIASCREIGQNPKKVIFGTRKVFEQLKKNHLTGKKRRQLKKKWKESRQGNLYSRGDKSKQGNLNLRFEWISNELYLRINTGDRQYVYAKVIRDVKREKDKWIEFTFMLENAYRYKAWFPYSVNLKIKNGNVYAFISIEEKYPPITIKRNNGIIGIDVNAYPFHLALAFTVKTEFRKYQELI